MDTRSLDSCLPILALACLAGTASAKDHRDATFVSANPKIDGTDFYMFRSYEEGREDYVTMIANYQPLQDPESGPCYYPLDDAALYEIHVDQNGNGRKDLTFRFRFQNQLRDNDLAVGEPGSTRLVSRPLVARDGISALVNPPEIFVEETYTLDIVQHTTSGEVVFHVRDAVSGSRTFHKPTDYIGARSISAYETYADAHVYDVQLPSGIGRVFVGQRKDSRVMNMGELFDLMNTDVVGGPQSESDSLVEANVTSIAIEVPSKFLKARTRPLGAWTTASLQRGRDLVGIARPDQVDANVGPWMQVSRVGNPLVGSLLIGLDDKDRYNFTPPYGDGSLFDYFTHPVLPEIIEEQTGLVAPNVFPRWDVDRLYLRGVPGITETGSRAEMLRFRFTPRPVPAAQQRSLGLLAGDRAGYPNGRRPGDDVVDVALRILMGWSLPAAQARAGKLPYTDGVRVDATMFDDAFPYLKAPLGGSPN